MIELEKKAEEYAKNCENKKEIYCLLNLDFNSCLHCGYFKHYMKGYEQGQKDMPLSGQLVHEVERLKKENEELKAINKSLTEENNILVKDLGCETCSIHLEYKNLNNQIEKLKAQIEKMKRCENCLFFDGYSHCNNVMVCKCYNKWELAE